MGGWIRSRSWIFLFSFSFLIAPMSTLAVKTAGLLLQRITRLLIAVMGEEQERRNTSGLSGTMFP